MSTPTCSLAPLRRAVPPGVVVARSVLGRDFKAGIYRTTVLVITFIAYTCYHASRKPPSIVKSVLDPERYSPDPSDSLGPGPWPLNLIFVPRHQQADFNSSSSLLFHSSSGWAPFDSKGGKAKLGEIDVAFLACYAFGMFFAGHFGDRLDLRLFLTLGMIGSGTFVCLFGMGYWWQIHSLYYFLGVQMMAGLFQATGWPSVVAIVGNWCGKRKRGLVMGVWNAHTSVGNILGSLVATSVLASGWGWSFLLPGLLIMFGGILVFLFLVVDPSDVGLDSPDEESSATSREATTDSSSDSENRTGRYKDLEAGSTTTMTTTQRRPRSPQRDQPVGFREAWRIPGVAPFAFCLFFSKLVAYTFLYWLPFYIKHTRIAGHVLSEKTAGNLSTLFDIGGVVGGVLAGHISDRLNARASTAAVFMYCAIPALYLYHEFGEGSMTLNVVLMMLAGMLINGPYALITTAVSADLGTHKSLRGDARALATVTAIIDGCGSVGAAVGPLLTGYISESGWDNVFNMLMMSALIAGLLLSRLVVAEVSEKCRGFTSESSADLSQPLMVGSGKV